MDDVANKDHKNIGEGIKGLIGNRLPEHPTKNKQNKEVESVHGTYSGGDYDGYFVVEFEPVQMFGINVLRSMAGFEVIGKTFGH